MLTDETKKLTTDHVNKEVFNISQVYLEVVLFIHIPSLFSFIQALRLLKEAWDRRLIFTIGTSVTTGMDNSVIWNEIHHKTEAYSNHSGHGYPDPSYLDNLFQELKSHGVVEET